MVQSDIDWVLGSHAASLVRAIGFYISDLNALADEDIHLPPSGAMRTVADFTYEHILYMRRCIGKMQDNPAPEDETEGWITAPIEYQSKERLILEIEDCRQQIELDIANSKIPKTDLCKLLAQIWVHTMYHDAQLNYLQTLRGDLKQHWVY